VKAGILAEPALVGREHELELLESFLNSAAEGKGKTVFISGEAGSGKSRLAHEFLKVAKTRSVGVMAGWCLSDAAAPYFPFVEAFNTYFALFEQEEPASLQKTGMPLSLSGAAQIVSEERGVTAWLTGAKAAEKPGKPQVISPQVWKDQVFAGVARTLHVIAAQNPIILFIEDIHWADSASLALLHYVARAVDNSERILIVATFRSEELTADAEGHPHPLVETLRLMKREDLFTEINLSSLTLTDVSRIAEKMVGGSVDLVLADRLYKESQGNALFVVESLRMLAERKSLIQENNQWRLTVDELGIPSKIKDIILRRLAILKYNQRRVLDAASVIGEKFDVELLSDVLGQDNLEILETLNTVSQSTSLVCAEGNFYRFDHAKSREALYEEIPQPLKRGYHARIAERMEKTSKDGKLPFADLAYHYAQAGNSEKALGYALEAGKDAFAKFSNAQAINHFTYALQTVGEDPKRSQERTDALEELGDAFEASNMFSEAMKVFEQLISISTGVLKLRALRKAASAAWHKGSLDFGMEFIDKAEEYIMLDRLEAARIYTQKAALFGAKGQFGFHEWSEKALQIFEEEYYLPGLAQKLADVSFADATQGELEKGLAKGLLSVALFGEIGDLRQQFSTYNMLGMAFALCCLFPESQKILQKALEIEEKVKLGDLFNLTHIYWQWAGMLESQGDLEQAITKSLKALEFAEKTDSASSQGTACARLVIEYAKEEDPKSAEKYFEMLMKLPPQSLQSGFTQLSMVKAFYFASKKNWQESMLYFKEHLEFIKKWSGANGKLSPRLEAEAKRAYAWALAKQGQNEEAAAMAQEATKIIENAQKRFEHANVHTNLLAFPRVTVGQSFDVRIDLVNVSRGSASLANIQDILPQEFQVIASQPEILKDGSMVRLKESELEPFTVKTIKLTVQATMAGTFDLNPRAVYIDDLGQTKTATPRQITITVKPAEPAFEALPGRVTTGSAELDRLLLGGIPKNYAIMLTAPLIDERALIVKRFLEAGANAGETTFYVTTEARDVKVLAEKLTSNFFLFVCNVQANAMIQDLPNVFKLNGIENLTDINITLTKVFRAVKPSAADSKRICIDIVSDILLQHHAVTTRKWLCGLLADLRAKGFTTLVTLDPKMHQPEEVQAILGLFDGEINVSEKENAKCLQHVLRVRKLYNQKYLGNELILNMEPLE
jgi:KaiC/GvpD/RAD55 family RecA-like ATPase